MTVFSMGYSEINEAWGDMAGKKKKKKNQDPICDLYEMKGNSSAYSETELINYAYDKSRNQRTYSDRPQETKKVVINREEDMFETKPLPNSLFEKQFEVKHPGDFAVEDPKEYMVKACPATTGQSRYDSDSRTDDGDDIWDDEMVRMQRKHVEDEKSRVYPESPPSTPRITFDEMPSRRQVRDERNVRTKETYYDDFAYDTDEEPLPPPRQRKVKQETRRHTYTDDESDIESEYSSYVPKKRKPKFVYLDILLYVLSGIILIFLLEQFVKIGINMQMV